VSYSSNLFHRVIGPDTQSSVMTDNSEGRLRSDDSVEEIDTIVSQKI